jgi:hypothetical protein
LTRDPSESITMFHNNESSSDTMLVLRSQQTSGPCNENHNESLEELVTYSDVRGDDESSDEGDDGA